MEDPKSSSARTTILSVLNGQGDSKFTWDHSKAEDREMARSTIADLKSKGYSFFRTDGEPADEIASGAGELIVRKVSAEEIMPPEELSGAENQVEPTAERPKRRGRPPKADKVVAVRPLAGG